MKKAKECKCWCSYPNESMKRGNGTWKCVDCYELVKAGGITKTGKCTKTVCRLKEETEEN